MKLRKGDAGEFGDFGSSELEREEEVVVGCEFGRRDVGRWMREEEEVVVG